MQLNTDTREIVEKEFPWLKLPDKTEEFLVKRIEPGFFDKTASGYESNDGAWYPSGWIKFFDSKGRELFEAGRVDWIGRRKFWTWKWPFVKKLATQETKFFRETVGEALFRLGTPTNNVHYVIISREYSHPYTITLFKPPKDFSVKDWYEKVLEKAQTELTSQLQEIEAEADKIIVL